MRLIVRNTTERPIEIDSMGLTVGAGQDLDIRGEDIYAEDFSALVQSGSLLLVNSDGSALSPSYSFTVLSSMTKPAYESGYSRDQVDALIKGQKTYTDSSIAELSGSAPGVLDTLNEIADALGDDPDFAATITTKLANKSDSDHEHDDEYYKKPEVDSALAGKANLSHDHNKSYYQKNEVDSALAGKSNSNHHHTGVYSPVGHGHDDLYFKKTEVYTREQVDTAIQEALDALPKFGHDFARVFDDSVTTTTSTWWNEKVILPVTVANEGWYRIGWSYMWNLDSTSYDFNSEIGIRNAEGSAEQIFVEHFQEPKDAGGSFVSTGSNQRHNFGAFKHIYLTPGSYAVFIRFRTTYYGVEASMWNAGLEFWRTQ